MPLFFDVGSQCVKVHDGKKSSSHAAVVAYTDKMLVANEAKKELSTRHLNAVQHLSAALKTRHELQLKHPKGEADLSIELGLAMIFSKLRKLQKSTDTEAIIAVPNGLSGIEVQRLRTAAVAAGITSPTFVPSTLVVAMRWSKYCKEPETLCLVVDVGCRFTSASVVQVSKHKADIIATYAMREGGYDVDKMFLASVDPPASSMHPNSVLAAIERTKKDLSMALEAKLELREHVEFVKRKQLEEAARPFLDNLRSMISRLTAAHPEVTLALLVGGAGRMPCVREVVQSGGGRGMNLPIEVLDPDFASVEGCSYWATMGKASTAKTPTASPFRFTSGEGLLFTDKLQELVSEGYVYQHLSDATCERPVSHEEIKAAHEELVPISKKPPPLEGYMEQSDHGVTVLCKVSSDTEMSLGVKGAEGDVEVVSPLVGCPVKTKSRVEDNQKHYARMEDLGEWRNNMEEATLRVECLDDLEQFEGAHAEHMKYIELACKMVKESTLEDLPNMPVLADLVNALVDTFEGTEGADVEELVSEVDAKFFGNMAAETEWSTTGGETAVEHEALLHAMEQVALEEEFARGHIEADEDVANSGLVKQQLADSEAAKAAENKFSFRRVAFFTVPVLFAGLLGRCWFGSKKMSD